MASAALWAQLEALDAEDRVDLINALSRSLVVEAPEPAAAELAAVDGCLAEFEADPGAGMPWDEALAELRAKLA